MSEQMEKLAEEMARKGRAYWEPYVKTTKALSKRDLAWATRFITRIGKAYADGGLELPREVGRWIPSEESRGNFSWRILKEIGHAPILIALRKEGKK